MALVKVFMPTYRRNDTFVRSVQSLLSQTFTDWHCSVHNDDPINPFPENYITKLNDPRFSLINHTCNLGPVSTFNLAFFNCTEKYLSILEDDNWWEPTFLSIMVEVMESHQNAPIAWSNMRLWAEGPENTWLNTENTVWQITGEKIIQFAFPNFKQAYSALHSNGAMLLRNKQLGRLVTPEFIRFDFIEPIRERAIGYPMLLVEAPLANFALTIKTSRSGELAGLYEHSLLLIDSFFKCASDREEYALLLWNAARQDKLRSYLKLLYTGITCKASRTLLRKASLSEWLIFFAYNLKHPHILKNCLGAKTKYAKLWEYLLKNTSNSINEIRS
jgi:glycosyltransferase involved in cell wall biosynthesis